MTESLEWGPRRPAAVSWAGVLLFLTGLFQLIAIGIALVLDSEALFSTTEFAVATVFVLVFAFLQLPTAVGVIRMGSGWRLFALGLAAVGLLLQSTNVVEARGEPILITVNVVLAAIYLLVLILLIRSRDAFA